MYPQTQPRGLFGTAPAWQFDPTQPQPAVAQPVMPQQPSIMPQASLPQMTAPTAQAADPHANLKRIIGIIGDFAGGLAGRPALYAQMEEQRRQEALQAAREQQQLANEYALFDYKQAHTAPDMSEFDKNAIAGGYTPGTPEWATLHKNHADEMADPVVQTPNGMMLRSQAIAQMQGQSAPPGVTFTPISEGGPGAPPPGARFPHIERYYRGQ